MSVPKHGEPAAGQPGVDADLIELLAARVVEMLAGQLQTPANSTRRPGRLLSATEVSEWWGVRRSWVYQHADQLGAIRIGDGERPRLRFDLEQVARHLNQPSPRAPRPAPATTPRRRRSQRIRADSPRLAFRVDPELLSPGTNTEMAGRRTNAPGRGAEDKPPAR